MSDFEGIFVELPTPFTTDASEIDEANIDRQVTRLINAGVHGIVPTASTGEFTTLSLGEHMRVIERVVAAADGRVPVIAGTGALTTQNAMKLSERAADVGAAAVLVVAPYYGGLKGELLTSYLTSVADAARVPLVYYHIPGATGIELSADQIADLGRIRGVDYVKETSGDVSILSSLLMGERDKITTFNGWDTLSFYGLVNGAKACIWGAASIFPELSVQLWEAISVRGNLHEAREVWTKLWPVCQFLGTVKYAAGVKAGLDLIGASAGPVRLPLKVLSEDNRHRLSELLRMAGLPVETFSTS